MGLLSEVWDSISRNKLRVSLTGFSVAFGILMLIILLGAGNGLLNGIMYQFRNRALNTMEVHGWYTSKEWHGHARRRSINLEQGEWDAIAERYGATIEQSMPCVRRSVTIGSGKTSRSATLYGYMPEGINTTGITIQHGRWINQLDMQNRRKVMVTDAQTAEALFLGQKAEDCVGRWVKVDSLAFQLVGIGARPNQFAQTSEVYAPYSTLTTIYSGSTQNLSNVQLLLQGLETAEEIERFENQLHQTYARVKDYDPTDQDALWIRNTAESYVQTVKIFNGLRLFIWIIGLASLVAGVVGISNIMLITVRERTREFGIRKAIGARPGSIVRLVLVESVAITLLFGYIGMLIGIGIVNLVDSLLSSMPQDGNFTVFRNPQVDFSVVIAATAVMVLAGLIAGYVPAKRAVKIKPVEALAS